MGTVMWRRQFNHGGLQCSSTQFWPFSSLLHHGFVQVRLLLFVFGNKWQAGRSVWLPRLWHGSLPQIGKGAGTVRQFPILWVLLFGNKAGYTATLVACGWAEAVLEKVTRASGQELYAQKAQKCRKSKKGTNQPTQPTDGPTNGPT